MSKILIDEADLKLALDVAYLAGFNVSGEGYNGEYPFRDHDSHPEQDACWLDERAAYIGRALADLPAQYSDIVSDGGLDPRNKLDVPAHQCKWPTCQSEEYQQALAEQIKRELVGEQPAQQEPVAKDNSNYRLDPPGLDQLYTSLSAQQEHDIKYCPTCAVLSKNFEEPDLSTQLTPAQQEPFGYFKAEPFGWTDCAETDEGAVALYEHPSAQRHWQGLTDEEVRKTINDLNPRNSFIVASAIEAKLKQKNT